MTGASNYQLYTSAYPYMIGSRPMFHYVGMGIRVCSQIQLCPHAQNLIRDTRGDVIVTLTLKRYHSAANFCLLHRHIYISFEQ